MVDVFGEMEGAVRGHHHGGDVEQNHLNRLGEIVASIGSRQMEGSSSRSVS